VPAHCGYSRPFSGRILSPHDRWFGHGNDLAERGHILQGPHPHDLDRDMHVGREP
jgi:hypothetical protein